MFLNLLDDASKTTNWPLYIVLGVLIVAFVVWIFLSGRKNKSRQKEYVEQLEAIRPGHKVKTAGGICGVVVEVCDDNTVIIETGSEASGKSYVKMDKELIAQTDAKGPTQIAREEAEARRAAEKAAKKAGEAKQDETPKAEPVSEEPKAEEAPAEEPKAEEASAESSEENK